MDIFPLMEPFLPFPPLKLIHHVIISFSSHIENFEVSMVIYLSELHLRI